VIDESRGSQLTLPCCLVRQAAWVRANVAGAQSQLHAQVRAGDYTMKRSDKVEAMRSPPSNCPVQVQVHGLGGPMAGEWAVDSHVLLRSMSLWLTNTVRTV
jgi:hypothetical protein